jgi:ribosome-associated protein
MAGPDGTLEITAALAIPWRELEFRATTGGGPGGQHVNRSATRIELWWDVAHSQALDEPQRQLLLAHFARRLDGTGRLRLVSGEHRSQAQNREAVVKRLVRLIAAGLHVPRPRKPTKPSRAARARRLESKRKRGAVKRERQRRDGDE